MDPQPPHPPPPATTVTAEPAFTLEVSDVLGTTASVIGKNPVTLLAAAALIALPFEAAALVVPFVVPTEATVEQSTLFVAVTFLAGITTMAGSFVAQGAAVYITVEHLTGKKVGVGDALRKGLQRFWSLVGASLLMMLITSVGFMACIIPGFIALVAFYVTIPAVIVEGAGPIEALGRSRDLLDSFWGQVFVVFIVVLVANWLVTFALALVQGALMLIPHAGPVISFVFGWMSQAVTFVLSAVAPAVIYTRLRGLREGVDVQALAQVFA